MNYANLISAMSAVIKANGNNEITGNLLQQVLRAIINSLGQGYQFMGVATTATDPGTQDARLFYVAEGPGTYSNFGPLTVPDDGQIYLLVLGASWAAVQLPIPTFAGFSDLVTEVAGKMALVPTATEGHVAEFGNAGQVRDGGVQTSALARRDAGATAGNLAEFDGNGDPKDSGIAAGDVMKIPAGLMPFGPAGLAEALLDTDSEGAEQEFSLRKSGGDGGAYFRRLLGNTKAFNQLIDIPSSDASKTENGVTITDNRDGSFSVVTDANGATATTQLQLSCLLTNGHKYLLRGCPSGGSNSSYRLYMGSMGTDYGDGLIFTASNTGSVSFPRIYIPSGLVISTPIVFRPQVSDLTAMPDTSTTPEEFREKYPLLYYAYGRKLIHNKVAKVITKGANQWDEVWELGSIGTSTGTNTPSSSHIRSKNYIPVFPSATYYNKGYTLAILGYDADKNFVGVLGNIAEGTFTIPSNVYYIRFYRTATTYANDICINLSDAGINGQYFPYWERELALDITNQEDTDGNKPFAEGMMGAGSAADYANEVGGAKVMGVVDMGDLTWNKYAQNNNFYATGIVGMRVVAGGGVPPTIICPNYVAVNSITTAAQTLADKTIAERTSGPAIVLHDSAYESASAADFKAAMAGVKLVFELATPVPFTWKEPLNTGIKVSKYGTEEITPAQTENIDNAPFRAVTTYSISVANLIAALSALGNRGGAKGSLGSGNQGENPENEELTPEEESPKEEEQPKEEETPAVEPIPEVQSKK